MRKVTLQLPTKVATDLGVVNARFFRHNESLTVLQAFAAGDAVTQVVRIRRRGPLPPNAAIERRRGELLGRYALGHFEILERNDGRREVTALITWKMPRELATLVREFGANVVPTQPFVIGPEETVVSFYAAEDRLPVVHGLLGDFGIRYRISSVRTSTGERVPMAALTERQRSVLELGYRLGYYDTPARIGLDRMADLLGVSKAAVSRTLRRAEARLVAAALGIVP